MHHNCFHPPYHVCWSLPYFPPSWTERGERKGYIKSSTGLVLILVVKAFAVKTNKKKEIKKIFKGELKALDLIHFPQLGLKF